MDADTPAVRNLREHLLRLATHSIPPGVGATRAREHSPEEDAVLRRFAPFAELLYLVAASDGTTHPDERGIILGAFRALTGGRVSGQRLRELEVVIRERLETSEPEVLLEEVASDLALQRQDAELAFSLAAAVVVADRMIHPEEEAFLSVLGDWLHIRPERAHLLLSGAKEDAL